MSGPPVTVLLLLAIVLLYFCTSRMVRAWLRSRDERDLMAQTRRLVGRNRP